ncbi:MAG TPA: metal ABC transporter substrate-binding protein [Acidimicrobiales bacterium]|nr:metal ABC transporter substrate-binding protein [Acidimicrobiales bacterium]
MLSAMAVGMVACGGNTAAAGPVHGRALRVVTTTTQLSDFARVIGGADAAVYDVVRANVDPHDYEPTPADVEALRRADLIVENGVGLEAWLDRTIESSGSKARVVDASTGVALRKGDPHIWHDPTRAKVMVTNIAGAMGDVDPDHAGEYAAALTSYGAQLDALDVEIRGQIAPLTDKKLVTNHDAFGYYVERYGMQFVGSVIPSFDSQAELSSRQLSALVSKIKAQGVKAVFSESSLPPKTAETVAAEAGVKVVSGADALYGDTLGPPGSDADTYLKMMRHNTRTIVAALR